MKGLFRLVRTALSVGLACSVLVCCTIDCRAQRAYGAFANMSLNTSTAFFEQLEGVINCNTFYTSGSGTGLGGGLFYEHTIAGPIALGIRGQYRQANTTLISSEHTAIAVDGVETAARIDHTLDASLGVVALQPLLRYAMVGGLAFSTGLELGYTIQHTFEQRETLEQPADAGAFLNGGRTRNVQTGEIPNANKFIMSWTAGLSYALPLNADNTLQLVPELSYRHPLTPVVQGITWTISSFTGGIGIRFVIPPSPSVPEEPPVVKPDTTPIIVQSVPPPVVVAPPPAPEPDQVLTTTIATTGVSATGVESPVAVLQLEEIASSRVIPLLPYLFFDGNETVLPQRYTSSTEGENALAMHRSMLRELGRRMQSDPTATLRITGITSTAKDAIIADETAKSRARAVAKYLNTNYNIPQSKLLVASSPLPAATTPSTLDADGVAEINRVELSSSSAALLGPVRLNDTIRSSTPPTLRFRTTTASTAPVLGWEIRISQEGKGLKTFKGQGAAPEMVNWTMDLEDQATIPRFTGALDIAFATYTGFDTSVVRTAIPVEQVTLQRKRVTQGTEKVLEQFNILLFDIGSAELTAAQRAMIETDVKPRIQKNSAVTITGHTDRIGDAAVNAALSRGRAMNTARALGLSNATIRGEGESDLVFDNTTPEGRCLCRTVVIRVETEYKAP